MLNAQVLAWRLFEVVHVGEAFCSGKEAEPHLRKLSIFLFFCTHRKRKRLKTQSGLFPRSTNPRSPLSVSLLLLTQFPPQFLEPSLVTLRVRMCAYVCVRVCVCESVNLCARMCQLRILYCCLSEENPQHPQV